MPKATGSGLFLGFAELSPDENMVDWTFLHGEIRICKVPSNELIYDEI